MPIISSAEVAVGGNSKGAATDGGAAGEVAGCTGGDKCSIASLVYALGTADSAAEGQGILSDGHFTLKGGG